MSHSTPDLIVVSVGNTRTRFAPAFGGRLEPASTAPSADAGAVADALLTLGAGHADARILVASVNDPAADRIDAELASRAGLDAPRPIRFKRDLEIPITNALDDDSTVGSDRLLSALGAFARSRQACIVVDAGTAVTVDFVDGTGVFQGGAIAPGIHLMCRALHEHTAALPLVTPADDRLLDPAAAPFGKTTPGAIDAGVKAAVVGMTHLLIDRYASYYGGYPRVIATGGDAPLLFDRDELVEHIVPDLTLVGMLEAWNLLRTAEAQADLDTDE